MSELRVGNRLVETVFDLRGRDENAMTFALAWGMSRSDALVTSVIGRVSPVTFDPSDAVISVQRVDDLGITDIEVEVAGRLHVIFEAKRGWTLPEYAQLDRYARLLHPEAADRRLVALTQWGAADYATHRIAGWDLDVPCDVIGWSDVLHLTEACVGRAFGNQRRVLTELVTYLKGVVDMRDPESTRVLVVSLSRTRGPNLPLDSISIVEQFHRYAYPATGPWPKVPPNYIGFRYGGQLRYLCHVDNYAITTRLSDYFPGALLMEHPPNFILDLGPFIPLGKAVPAGPKVQRNSRVWADLDLLLTSDTITDAVRLTKERGARSLGRMLP